MMPGPAPCSWVRGRPRRPTNLAGPGRASWWTRLQKADASCWSEISGIRPSYSSTVAFFKRRCRPALEEGADPEVGTCPLLAATILAGFEVHGPAVLAVRDASHAAPDGVILEHDVVAVIAADKVGLVSDALNSSKQASTVSSSPSFSAAYRLSSHVDRAAASSSTMRFFARCMLLSFLCRKGTSVVLEQLDDFTSRSSVTRSDYLAPRTIH